MADRTVAEYRLFGTDGEPYGPTRTLPPFDAKWLDLIDFAARQWPQHAPFRLRRRTVTYGEWSEVEDV